MTVILVKPHAEKRMAERGIRRYEVQAVILYPREKIDVRFGRIAVYGVMEGRQLVVIYEKRNEEIEVITTFWADKRRLKRLGFVGI